MRWNLIFVNPVSSVRVPKGTTPEQRVWTAAEARQFLAALADDRLVALWTLALRTGMRRGELADLRWSDVDLDAGTLTVAQQRASANYEEVIAAPKAKSHRQLLLAPATVVALRDHLRRQRKERLRIGPAWTDSGYLFVGEAGVEYHPQRFTKLFAEAVEKAGVPNPRLHDTRHTMATLALEAGVHPKVVQEQLGHSAIAVTLDTSRGSASRRACRQDRRPVRRVKGRSRRLADRTWRMSTEPSAQSSLIEKHRDEIIELVHQHRARSIAVFGSVAHGEATSDSDIDFLVEFEPSSSLLDLIHLEEALSELLGVSVDVISAAALLERDTEIRRDAIAL